MRRIFIAATVIVSLANFSLCSASENHHHSDTKMEAHNPANETKEAHKTYHSHSNKKHNLDYQKMNSQIISGSNNVKEAHNNPEPLSNENNDSDVFRNHPMNDPTLRDR